MFADFAHSVVPEPHRLMRLELFDVEALRFAILNIVAPCIFGISMPRIGRRGIVIHIGHLWVFAKGVVTVIII